MLQKIKDLNLAPFVVSVLFIALLIPTIVSSYILITQERQNQLQELEKFTKSASKILASSLAIPLWEFREDSAMRSIEPILEDKRIVLLRVTDIQTGNFFIDINQEGSKGNILTHSEFIFNDKNKIGQLNIGVSDFYMQQELQKTIIGYTVLFLFQLLISIGILLIAIYTKILSPIKRLTLQANKLSQNQLENSFEWVENDEIGRLGKSFEYARYSLLQSIEQIRLQKDRLANIILGTNAGTWEWNIQTGETIFNEKWAQIIGYTLDEISPVSIQTWAHFVHPDDLKISNAVLQEHLDGKSDFYECEARMKHKDGSWAWVLDRGKISRWDKDGKPLFMSGTHQDITEQKRAQNAIEAAKTKAEIANKAKSEFLANMSHEIRTPMNAVTGLSEVLGEMELQEEQKIIVSKINSSSKILLGIINDILDYSKIEAGKLELEHKEFLTQNLQISLETLFAQKAKQKNIALEFEFDKKLPYSLITDELRLTQVLTNLTSNALKFTHKGEVKIRLDLVKKINQSKALISFCIKDSGIGISQEQLKKLFQPFTQADTSTTRKFGGTGLGLVITQNIIQALGSKLHIDTDENVGTKVSFTLELEVGNWLKKDTNKSTMQTDTIYEDSLDGIHVLLVEDNEANQMVASLMLEKVGINVSIANNGKEGLDMFLQNPDKFHLILMDLQMPIMSGYEATKEIRKYDKNIPIIALTAAAMIEDKQKVLEAQMNEHLSKPINKSELYSVISNFTNKKIDPPELKKGSSNGTIDFHILESITDSKEVAYNLLSKLQSQLTQGEFKDILFEIKNSTQSAHSLIHTLKGVSGNLGAKEIFHITQEIDKKYKQKSEILQSDQDALKEAIDNFLAQVNGMESIKTVKSQILQKDELQNLITQIKKSLKESSFIPAEKLKLLLDNLEGTASKDSLSSFNSYVEEFEFEKALEILNKVTNQNSTS